MQRMRLQPQEPLPNHPTLKPNHHTVLISQMPQKNGEGIKLNMITAPLNISGFNAILITTTNNCHSHRC